MKMSLLILVLAGTGCSSTEKSGAGQSSDGHKNPGGVTAKVTSAMIVAKKTTPPGAKPPPLPAATYRVVAKAVAKQFRVKTGCLQPEGFTDLLGRVFYLNRDQKKMAALVKEGKQKSPEFLKLQAEIRRNRGYFKKLMVKRGSLGDGGHYWPYYLNLSEETAVRYLQVPLYEAVSPSGSPGTSSVLYWPPQAPVTLIPMGKQWTQGFYVIPDVVMLRVLRPKRFQDIGPKVHKALKGVGAIPLSIREESIMSRHLMLAGLYLKPTSVERARKNLAALSRHPVVVQASIFVCQSQIIPEFF
ncbi:hypothetical protein KKF84_08930 [Myxococcota bacterium]|nr:hypothetical protein [Myxococcota bacterium]MBU1535433.1 hypothetical protein [Myxococcota bacterium]